MSVAPGAGVRAQAARSLLAVLGQGRSLKAEMARVLPGIADPRDRALLEAICFSVLRHLRRYNGIPRKSFHLFLAECEWRFNHAPASNLLQTLCAWTALPLHSKRPKQTR